MKFSLSILIVFVALQLQAQALQEDDLESSVALMGKIGSASSPSFSPDGKTIAFVSNISGSPQVWTMPGGSGFPKLITAFDDPVGFVTWSPDAKWLAFNVAPGGGLNEQIYISRPDGSELKRLTDGGKENNFLGDWTRDGKQIYFDSNRRDPSSTDAYLFDLSSNQIRMVAETRGVGGIEDVSYDGRLAVLNRLINRGDNNLYLIDLTTGKEALLTPHEGPGSFLSPQFARDGRAIYFASNKDRDLLALARIEISNDRIPGDIEVVAAREDGELSSLFMSDDGAMLALIWNIGGRSELSFYDMKNNQMKAGPKLPSEIAFGLDFTQDGSHLAITLSGSASPGNIWSLDLKTNQFTQLTDSPHAGVDLTKMIKPEFVEYTAEDGLKLSGWLYKPNGVKEPLPIVLNFHGGPEGQERPGFNSTYQALLSRGIAVFGPNVRGSSGFGKKFVNLDNGALREGSIKDIKASVEYVVKSGIADPKRIGIMGGSYGGYMVMQGLTQYPELFAAGANLFGVTNFETFFKHTEPWMASISKIEYGDPDKEVEMLRRLSPIHQIDRIKAPTIVLHGANDTNVPVIEAEQVVENLKKRNVPVEYVLFSDEGHGWRKTPNRVRSAVSIVKFFETYLKSS